MASVLAEPDRLLQARSPERQIRDLRPARQQPQRNFRSIAVERLTDRPAALSDNADGRARLGASLGDIGSVDPRMPGTDPLFTAMRDGYDAHESWPA